ncbi:hypothetical protein X757_31205 [Mesorhizobium sp. LSHC414A00]|nr:hypothetical protein X757_31205 [Mesorhizobium sp. LSHC414A00]ESZ55953.1 hypothetical protein X729_25220 [Mesorhizobium sp. L103C131B0]
MVLNCALLESNANRYNIVFVRADLPNFLVT